MAATESFSERQEITGTVRDREGGREGRKGRGREVGREGEGEERERGSEREKQRERR